MEVYVITDCTTSGRNGAYSAVLVYGDQKKVISGGAHETTSPRMSLMSALRGVEAIKKPCNVTVFGDNYLAQNYELVPKWQERNWRRATGGKIHNTDLWIALKAAIEERGLTIKFERKNADAQKLSAEELKAVDKVMASELFKLQSEDFFSK